MKRTRIGTFSALFALTAAAFAVVVEKVPLDELIRTPKTYDGKTLSTTGVVADFRQRTSRVGNKYFTFKLAKSEKSPAAETINVYSQGQAEEGLKNGVRVEAIGVFRVEKKLQDFTVKNEVDATKVKDKENGIRILKEEK